jgi:hypothetical protein
LLTGVKPPDALTRAAALVNGQPDPLAPASVANPAIGRDVDAVLAKAMAQNREQRYATAADMRNALHETEQVATVVNRGEAQTMLFPPSAPNTVATPTRTVARQNTVKTGETTVVRPVVAGSGRRVLPWVLSAAALLVLACGVFAFFALQKRNRNDVVQVTSVTTAPSPNSSVIAKPTVTPAENPNENPQAVEAQSPTKPAPKKQEKATRNEPPARNEDPARNPHREEPRVEVDPGHINEPPPDVPVPPNVQGANRQQRKGQTRVVPGGVTIRTFPNGSQIITMRDGTRVYVAPDGTRTVFGPGGNRIDRRPPRPAPSP